MAVAFARIPRPPLTVSRWWRAATYASSAGVPMPYLLIEPSEFLRTALGAAVPLLLACMVIGAVLALAGAVLDRWIGEFVGLPMLAAALLVFGTTLIALSGGAPGRGSFGLVLMALLFVCVGRWQQLWRFVRTEVRRRGEAQGE